MNKPKMIRVLLIITAHLLTRDHVNSDSSASCTHVKCEPCTSRVVAYWPMNLGKKGSDLSGNENHAIFHNLTYTDGPTGEYKGAVHFNGDRNSFAWVTNSPSMDVGKYPGFSFSGFVKLGIPNKSATLIDWSSSDDGYGMFVAPSQQSILIHLYPRHNHDIIDQKAEFPNMKFIAGSWHFFGISYDKATGRVTAFMDGRQEQKQLDKNIVAGTARSSKVGLGTDLRDPTFSYHGDMSCMMLFNVSLTSVEFEIVRNFCCGVTSTQTPAPTMSIMDVIRADSIVTIRWQQVVAGHYTAIKVKYCQTGTEDCVYIALSPDDTYATWFVDPDKTYYYYVMLEDGSDVVYTSDSLVAKAAPKIYAISVSREDNKVTIRWGKVIGKHTAIKIKYCLTVTKHCVYIAPSPDDTSETWFVDPAKTYYYYMMMENGSDVVYTSDRLETVIAAPKMSVIGVSRIGNTVTIRWKQVVGKYTAIKVKYCQTGTESCVHYIVPNPEDTSATWLVKPYKTYYYYMVIEDGDDIVYTSNPLVADDSDDKKDMVPQIVGGSVTGALILTAIGVILAVALWKRRRSRSRLANHTTDDDATRIALAASKNSPKHTYANIGTASVNQASSYSARTAKKYPAIPRVEMLYVPSKKVGFRDEPACSAGDVDIDEYDYTDTKWLRDASRNNHEPAGQTGQANGKQDVSAQIHTADQDDPMDASSYEDMEESGQKVGPYSSYDDVRIVSQGQPTQTRTEEYLNQATWQHNAIGQNKLPTHQENQKVPDDVFLYKGMGDLKPYVLCEKQKGQKGQEPEGTCDCVSIVTDGQLCLAVSGLGEAGLAHELTPRCSNDDVANGQQSQYEHLEPVDRHDEYLDFRGREVPNS